MLFKVAKWSKLILLGQEAVVIVSIINRLKNEWYGVGKTQKQEKIEN